MNKITWNGFKFQCSDRRVKSANMFVGGGLGNSKYTSGIKLTMRDGTEKRFSYPSNGEKGSPALQNAIIDAEEWLASV